MSVDENAWRRNVIEKALQYVNHEWYATDKNVLHGLDTDGRFVDTPDVTWSGEEFNCGWWKPNQLSKGIPYSWGNASTIEEFDRGILEGKFAGNVPEDKKRYGSHMCVGVDCSGLLTKYDTKPIIRNNRNKSRISPGIITDIYLLCVLYNGK